MSDLDPADLAPDTVVRDRDDDDANDADVAEVVFSSDLDREVPGWRELNTPTLVGRVAGSAVTTYSYPAPRLRRGDRR